MSKEQDPAGDFEPESAPLPTLDPDPGPDPDPEPTPGSLPERPASPGCASTLTPASDNPLLADSSSLSGKKKKGFFSKGKRLFKKLGSSKKEWTLWLLSSVWLYFCLFVFFSSPNRKHFFMLVSLKLILFNCYMYYTIRLVSLW